LHHFRSLIFAFKLGQHFGNRCDIDSLVHLFHGDGRALHGFRHGLMRLDGLQFETDAL
jgi:hypothetical protein